MNRIAKFLFEGDVWALLIKWGAIFIIAWALGKSLGLIQSPLIVEFSPYIAGGISLLGLGAGAGRLIQKLTMVEKNTSLMGNRLDRIDNSLIKVEVKVEHIERDIESVKKVVGGLKK